MFIIAAATFLLLHATFTTLLFITAVKFNTRFFTHAVMYLHGNAGGYTQV